MWRSLCSAVSPSILLLHWKLWLLLAILLVCLSSPPTVKHDSPNLHHITPLLSCLWDESFSSQTNLCGSCLCARAQDCVAAFSGSVCCIFWFIYTFLIVAPHACQESQSLACALCGPSQMLIWNIHECMNIFIVEKPLHIRKESHFL